jgi:hypothetical protein
VTHKQAHYLFCVKANQPTLLDRCAGLPWHRIPELDRTGDRGHGRVEVRTLKAVTVGHVGFPHVRVHLHMSFGVRLDVSFQQGRSSAVVVRAPSFGR